MKPLPIPDYAGKNFHTMTEAMRDKRLVLVSLTEKISGKQRWVICGLGSNQQEYSITPFGIVFDEEHDNPYEYFNPPAEITDGTPLPPTKTILDDLTKEQAGGLFQKWMQDHNGMTLQQFMLSAKPTFGMDGAVTVFWCNMWLAVEKDGYVHS